MALLSDTEISALLSGLQHRLGSGDEAQPHIIKPSRTTGKRRKTPLPRKQQELWSDIAREFIRLDALRRSRGLVQTESRDWTALRLAIEHRLQNETPGEQRDRRQSLRIQVDLPAKLLSKDVEPLRARIIEISEQGLLLTTRQRFLPGALLHIALTLEDKTVEVHAHVVATKGNALAIHIVEPTAMESRAAMSAYIDRVVVTRANFAQEPGV